MIPIIYEKDEALFVTNGLGRLRDCISCIVTEERNGIYECDFDYPVNGANYDLIQVGRIIGVTHDDTGDIQPFDIIGYTKPIDGIVTFHCVHISYRLTGHTIRGTNINSLAAALTQIETYSYPTVPFTFSTDMTATGYVAVFDGIPHTVRQVLGGVEGSILDTYGGEYEFDKWHVTLHSNRGEIRDFKIRYGVNMLDYNEEFDSSNCYNSCRPYWTDGQTYVVGDRQKYNGSTPSGREQCVPLDVSDKFESKPTKAQVETMGASVMASQNPTVPAQTIEVSFVRLQDLGEYDLYNDLLQCRLCDMIAVIFPDFNSSGQFKVVQTEWNVLLGRYESMQLGELATTLSEALGVTQALDKLSSVPIDVEAGHIQIGGAHICWGTETITLDTANTYQEVQVSLPYTYSATPNCFASCANRSARERTAYATGISSDHSKIYVGVYGSNATAPNNVYYVHWMTIGF